MSDIDTENQKISSFKETLIGRKNIIINANLEEFLLNPYQILLENLSSIEKIHKENVNQMKYLDLFFRGKQDILDKTRANGEEKINNKHITNYAWEYVNFKKGYYVGKPIKYVNPDIEKDESIKYFNMYCNDLSVLKSSKDLIKYEKMLITGIAYTMIIPKRKKYNTELESPFEYIVMDNENVCFVKSNDIFNTKLCSLCFSTIREEDKDVRVYTAYFNNRVLQFTKEKLLKDEYYPIYNPITEYQLNEQRMGVFEPILSSLNSMNKMRSNQLDLLEELINSFLTFENVDVSSILEKIGEFRKNRILVVETNNPQAPAKVGSVSLNNDTSTTNNTYDSVEQRTYDIIGVPMPTSSTGQGVSGEAQVYGGGWENAQTIANVDTNYIMQFEREDLLKMLLISGDAVNSKTKELNPFLIDIKYTINKSNNMLVKSQTFKYLRDLYVPFEQALEISELTDDPYTIAQISEKNLKQEKEYELELELKKNQNNINNNVENINQN